MIFAQESKFLFLATILSINLIVQNVSGSTIEDVELALQNLDQLSLTKQGELHLFMNEQANILRNRTDEMLTLARQEIDDQIESISLKISTLSQNVQDARGANVDACLGTANEDLEDFKSELIERLLECNGNMIQTGNSRLYSTWSKNWNEYDIDYQCSKMSFVQCRDHESEECVEKVLDSISLAEKSMIKSFELLKNDMQNRIMGMNFPCRPLIVQELALYPSLILNFVETCLDSMSSNAFVLGC